jgi:hypothetical protein
MFDFINNDGLCINRGLLNAATSSTHANAYLVNLVRNQYPVIGLSTHVLVTDG